MQGLAGGEDGGGDRHAEGRAQRGGHLVDAGCGSGLGVRDVGQGRVGGRGRVEAQAGLQGGESRGSLDQAEGDNQGAGGPVEQEVGQGGAGEGHVREQAQIHEGLVLARLDLEEEQDHPHEHHQQGALVDAAASSKATLTEMLLRLEKRGLVVRHARADDNRRREVELTPAGKELLSRS
ncbi:MarR family winged helix-turn-helix transcriptional regulator [Kocuria dechangensis]|uniref:MarR family winged helix-turn-helix transcriptional regulator n=1 Tax=Kocuria dechangensis TaxID=1176249 RepID=UPI00166BC7CE